MVTDLITVSPETTTLEAIDLMRANKISCIPVVKDDRLVGIVTEHDFMRIAGTLLEEMLRD
jgi:CBS domain-containing protein